MKNKIGNFFMFFGTALVLAALSLFLYNQHEAKVAGDTADELVGKVAEEAADAGKESDTLTDPYDTEMTVKEIDGHAYIGYLSIPRSGLELAVMSEWSYANLKISPCRYTGSTKSGDLVICAHNYKRHFGTLKEMKTGDEVLFTDMDGKVWQYEVAAVETLAPTAVEDMTAGEYDLSLFTCTYGGKSRVTVRCDLIE